jgi:CheY-like chemotaxis protein/HPt (histidine-containing phosphotransfer) domain-containing protein
LEAVSEDEDLGLPPGLREEYLQGARDQLGGIAELAERLVASAEDAEALDLLRREAHKIRGSAGSFGFPQATVVAAELEEAAKAGPVTGVAARAFVRRLAAALFAKQPAPAASRTTLPAPPSPLPAPPEPGDIPEVIVVEDDAALAELLTFGLEARGYRFVHYSNGREALAALRDMNTQGTAPLLLLDVDLPALDGYSIFETLTRESPGKFRVVFTTVHGSETEQLRGLEAGAIDYMVKPMSLRVALEKIRRWVGR